MAILVVTHVRQGSQQDLDQVSAHVEAAIAEQGAPPIGLMTHIAHPAGEGYVVQDVWRNEAEMRSFYDSVLLPAMREVGLSPEEQTISPVWSFARP